jgi:hypothetical protein
MADAPGRPNLSPLDYTSEVNEQIAAWAAELDAAITTGDYSNCPELPRI